MLHNGKTDQIRNHASQLQEAQGAGEMVGSTSIQKGESARTSAIKFKVMHVLVVFLALWLLVTHIVGMIFFGKGFLLTRLVLLNKSECEVSPVDDALLAHSPNIEKEACWHPKLFDKAVVIVVDALRYDFTVPFHPTTGYTRPSSFHNSFSILHDTAKTTPGNAFLLPFIADPPTTTLQRLKGLTTGTLPTFIDAGSNFAGTAIEEDNLLSQLRSAGKTLVHLGDDTWHSLFPGYFDMNLTRAYDSFNVWDLHTVDDGVVEHLIPLLQPSNSGTWDVIVGHFLGVDHAGHRYGPDHPSMTEKLSQMNHVVQDIMTLIDDETLLVVMGDHGMDTKGDHGGESDDEVEAAIWMYSKKPVFGRTHPAFVEPPRTAKERPIRQIDLVPTLSLLLGVPIPFNNLGAPIEEAFAGASGRDWRNLALVNRLTSEQIRRYQSEYSRAKDFSATPRLHDLQLRILDCVKDLGSLSQPDAAKWEDMYRIYSEYQQETLTVYRGLWANFNIPDMLHGIEILTGAFVFLLFYTNSLRGGQAIIAPVLLRSIGFGVAAGGTIGSGSGTVIEYFNAISGAFYGMGVGGIIASFSSFYQFRKQLTWPFATSVWGWLALVLTLSQAVGFASNSYTIHEDSILLFFLTTFGVIACVSSLRQSSNSDRILGTYHSLLFTLLSRLTSFSRLCREEQMPSCRSTFYASSTSSTSAQWHVFIPYAVALVLPEIIKAFYKGTASYEGSAGFWIGFCFRIGLLLVAAVWTIDAADSAGWLADSISPETLKTTSMTLARCVLAIALAAGIATFIMAKPCVKISVLSPSELQAASSTIQATVSEKNLAGNSPSAPPLKSRPKVTILGYANVHGSRYFLLIPVFILPISLLLPPMGQFSLAICSWQILCLVEILDTNGLTIDGANAQGSAIGPIVLAMLGSYHFFKTGHQAVLSSIQWNAAFVPLRTIHYPWSPMLLVLNAFGAQIICAIAVPLTVLWKRPISKERGALNGVLSDVAQAMFTHVLYYATMALATTMWAGHLRRHLMLYRVFMPRYLMASVVLVVVEIVLVAVAWMGVSVTAMSVGEVFGY